MYTCKDCSIFLTCPECGYTAANACEYFVKSYSRLLEPRSIAELIPSVMKYIEKSKDILLIK